MSTRGKIHKCRLGSGNTALHEAIANHQYETVSELLSQPETMLNKQNARGDTPLLYSLRTASCRCTLDLIDHGCDVNIPNRRLETPLHVAAQRISDCFTYKLLEKGADVNAKDCYGRTPLHNAVSKARIKNVYALLYYGACVDEKDVMDETPFMMALHRLERDFRPSDELSRSLLNYVVDFNERDINEYTPLYRAILQGSSIALDIINKGANVNQIVQGKHCINSSLTHYRDCKVFRAIWYRLNVNIFLKTEYLNEHCFLEFFFYYNNFSDADFLKCLYMIFESPNVDVLIQHFYNQKSRKTGDLMYHISRHRFRHSEQTEEVKVISLLLSHGFEIYFRDVAGLYEKHGYNSCVDLLLHNGSAIHRSESVRDHDHYRSLKVELMASKLCYDHFDIYSKVPDPKLDVQRNETRRFRKFYKANFDSDEIPNLAKPSKSNRFYTVIEVPSLVQLSRDLVRNVLYKKFCRTASFKVYQKISRLCVPEVIKDILRLKRAIY